MVGLLAAEAEQASSVFDEDRVGVELGGRAGAAVMHWADSAAGPGFGLELRVRFGPHLGLGVELEDATGSSPEGVPSWKLHRQQIALDLQWRFDTGPSIRPWVSLGMGFGRVTIEYDPDPFRATAHCVDLFRIGVGVDFLAWRHLALGPFVRYSLGSTRLETLEDAALVPPPDTHRGLNTLELGARFLVGF